MPPAEVSAQVCDPPALICWAIAGIGVGVTVGVGVIVAVFVTVDVAVMVGVLDGVGVFVLVGVIVGVLVGPDVRVAVGVAVGDGVPGGPAWIFAMNVPQSPEALDALYSAATQMEFASDGSTAAPE